MGKNIKKFQKISLEQCKTACDKNRRCLGIEYFRPSGARATSSAYKEGDCLLNSGTDLKNCDADYYQMFFWEKSKM